MDINARPRFSESILILQCNLENRSLLSLMVRRDLKTYGDYYLVMLGPCAGNFLHMVFYLVFIILKKP